MIEDEYIVVSDDLYAFSIFPFSESRIEVFQISFIITILVLVLLKTNV